ncbi:PIGO, partial [Symbiodinium sp. KB8]
YKPEHPEMAAKLKEMNGYLREVMAAIAEDTLLVVMGDHGMTMDGNHGGATRDETEAALFLYAKTNLRRPTSTGSKAVPRVEQIDLVPTLATLLGLPVPFGNLGSLLPGINYGRDTETLGATLAVTSQIARYLVAYNLQSPTLSEESLQRLQERLAALTAQATECMEQRCSSALSLAQDLH